MIDARQAAFATDALIGGMAGPVLLFGYWAAAGRPVAMVAYAMALHIFAAHALCPMTSWTVEAGSGSAS